MFLLFIIKMGVGMILALIGGSMFVRQLQNAQKRIDNQKK